MNNKITLIFITILFSCSKEDPSDLLDKPTEIHLQLKKMTVITKNNGGESYDIYEYSYNDRNEIQQIINSKTSSQNNDTLILVTNYNYSQDRLISSDSYYGYSQNSIDFFFQTTTFFFDNKLLTKAISCRNEHQEPRSIKYDLQHNENQKIIKLEISHTDDNCEENYHLMYTHIFDYVNNNVASLTIIDNFSPIAPEYIENYTYDGKINPKYVSNFYEVSPVSENNKISRSNKDIHDNYLIRYNEFNYPVEKVTGTGAFTTTTYYEYY